MQIENEQFYNTPKPKTHKVSVLCLEDSRRLLSIRCEECKFQLRCEPIQHKRENCILADYTETSLEPLIQGYVAAFAVNQFFILTANENEKKTAKYALRKIRRRFIQNPHGSR